MIHRCADRCGMWLTHSEPRCYDCTVAANREASVNPMYFDGPSGVCPCCGGWLDAFGRHGIGGCLPSAGGCPPGCSHQPGQNTTVVFHSGTIAAAGGAGGGSGGTVANFTQPCRQYVPGVGLVSAATPYLLEATLRVIAAQARAAAAEAETAALLREREQPPPPAIVAFGWDDYRPAPPRYPPPPTWPGYAAAARRLGQMTAVSVAVIGIPATLTHSWSSAWPPLLTVLLVIQILHLFAWRHRND